MDISYASDKKLNVDGIKKSLNGRAVQFQHEQRFVRADRGIVWGKLTSSLVTNRDNEPQFFLIVIEDIDIKKHAEVGMRYLQNNLEELVQDRTREAERARKSAEKSAKAKSQFLANMSHEIRTPLNAVLGFSQIGLRETSDKEAKSNFEQILNSGTHLLNVINDILDFSKIEAGKIELDIHAFNLNNLIKDVALMFEKTVSDKGLEFKHDFADDLPQWVKGDAQRIRQVLMNLLSNAVKFTENGSIVFSVSKSSSNHSIQFLIADSGIGMTQKQLIKLFRPFEQADSTTSRKYGGTGLGMSIRYDLIGLMDGIIDVNSEPGQGTEFVITLQLPETKGDETSDTTIALQNKQLLKGLNILLVDDIEANRLVADDLLQHEGANVILAESGHQAIEKVEQSNSSFDLILMDIQMPDMDGLETSRELLKRYPDLVIVGLTAHASVEDRNKSLAAGMRDQVTKPIETEKLLQVIASQLHIDHKQDQATDTEMKSSTDTNSDTPSASADVSAINWQAFLKRYDGREKFIEKLAVSFYNTHVESAEKIKQALTDGDTEVIRFLAHSIKGSAANIFADATHKCAAALENSAKQDAADIDALASRAIETLSVLIDEIASKYNLSD